MNRIRCVAIVSFVLLTLFVFAASVTAMVTDIQAGHQVSTDRAISFVGIFVTILMMVRSELVYRYRTKLHDQISAAAHDDIDRGLLNHWHRRYDIMETVSYGRMVLEFWKPLNAFYSPAQKRTMTEPHVTHL